MSKAKTAAKAKAPPKAKPVPPPPKPSVSGAYTKPLAISYESDGVSIGSFERESARKKGFKSIHEYREAVLKTADDSGIASLKKVAKDLRAKSWSDESVNPADNDKALKGFLDSTPYNGSNEGKKYDYGLADGQQMSHRRFWNYMYRRRLAYEADWQYKTSASYVANGTSQYADGLTIPGIARHQDTSFNLGTFVRFGKDDNPLRYARALDSGSLSENNLEQNIAAARNQGDYGAKPSAGPGTKGIVKSVSLSPTRGGGFNATDGFLNNEETQYAGWLAENKHEPYELISNRRALDTTMKKYESDEAFQQYKKDVKAALEAQKKKIAALQGGGADQVKEGVKGTGVGEEQLQIVTAKKPTKQGDEISHGKLGTYAGEDLQPVSTIDSKTVQGKAVVSGNDKVDVGGSPTDKPLVPPPKPKPLKLGSRGADVRAIQARLRKLGYDVDVDGIYGRQTATAVKAFQQRTALARDGVVGANTGAALFG